MTRNDKSAQINRICEEIQKNAHANQPRDLFRHGKHLTGKRVPKSEVVKDANGQILTESDDIKRRWKEYCEQLFKKDGHVTSMPLTFSDYEDEPDILLCEVENAVKKMKNDRSAGIDEIPAELIKATGEPGVRIFHQLCNRIWKTAVATRLEEIRIYYATEKGRHP